MLFARALACVGLDERDAVYWAGRSTLVKRPEDFDTYDRAFAAFWLGRYDARTGAPAPVEEIVLAFDTELPAAETPDVGDAAGRARPLGALEPDGDAPARRLRRVHTGRVRRSAQAHGRPAVRRRDQAVAPPPPREATRSPRRAAHGPPRAAHRRGTDRAALRDPSDPTPPHRAAARRQWIDGAVRRARSCASSTPPSSAGRASRRSRSARDSHASRASCRHVIRTRPSRPRPHRVTDWSGGTRLGEGLRVFNDDVGHPGHGAWRGGRDPLRRMGSRRTRAARRTDGTARTASRTRSSG